MAVGNTLRIDLQNAQNAHFNAVYVKNLVGVELVTHRIGRENIADNVGKSAEVHQLFEILKTCVKLVVAKCGNVETDSIHQLCHRARRLGIHIVEGVASAVVARTNDKQVGINSPKTIDHAAELSKTVEICVHIVDCENINGFVLSRNRKCKNQQKCCED